MARGRVVTIDPNLLNNRGKGGSGGGKTSKPKARPQYNQKPGYGKGGSGKGSGGGGGTTGGGGGGGGGGSKKTYIDGYNKAIKEFNSKKTDDKPQVAALKKMLNTKGKGSGFESTLRIKLANARRLYESTFKLQKDDYKRAAGSLQGQRNDNRKSASDASYLNLSNRGRERSEILAQTAAQGAGESDTLKSTMQVLRNWQANQSDVNRQFYDTNRAINTDAIQLTSNTRSNLVNAWNQKESERNKAYTDYYGQRVDAWTQMGNIQANPQSNAYKKGSDAFDNAAKNTGKGYKIKDPSKASGGFKGTIGVSNERLNNSLPKGTAAQQTNMLNKASITGDIQQKKPEGAKLRKW